MAEHSKPQRIGADVALGAAVRQLDVAVAEQERAVNRILSLIEHLQATAKDTSTRARLDAIVEACGFQDMTGQRIQKVSRLLRHVAQHAPVPIPPPAAGTGGSVTASDSATAPPGLSQEQVDRLLRGGKAS